MAMLIYIIIKFSAYSFWCYWLLNRYTSAEKPLIYKSLVLGLIRFLIGVIIGAITIYIFANEIYQLTNNKLLIYFSVYPPIRVLEWGFMLLVVKCIRSISFTATKKQLLLWVIGGVIISCLADIPYIATQGMALGRIFC